MPCGGSEAGGYRAGRLLRGMLLLGCAWFVVVQIRLSVPNAALLAHEDAREAAHMMRLIAAEPATITKKKTDPDRRKPPSTASTRQGTRREKDQRATEAPKKSPQSESNSSPTIITPGSMESAARPQSQAHPKESPRGTEEGTTEGTNGATTGHANLTTPTPKASKSPLPVAASSIVTTTTPPPSSSSSYDWSRVKGVELPRVKFQRHDHVVVGTKVMGPDFVSQLKQMLCLFTAAYNRHVNYDVVVFTTLPWDPPQVAELQEVIPNTKLTVALEGPPLEERLANLTVEERDYLYRRCRVSPGEQLTWYHFCSERPDANVWTVRLSYAWQAEFRAYHLWQSPALRDYKYMVWMDSDAICSRPWEDDPVQLMVDHNLVLMFDNIPGDFAENRELQDKMQRAYGRAVCEMSLGPDGVMKPVECTGKDDEVFVIPLVHGFHHITDLDFYRSANATKFLEILVESQPFSREWDDQMGVTMPALMEAPDRSWDLRSHNVTLGIFHNGNLDGKPRETPVKDETYTTYWNETVRHQWKAGRAMCDALVVHTGR